MSKVKRNWDLLSSDERRSVVREIIVYFKKERDEEIGMIAAEELLDFFLQTCGVKIHNQSVEEMGNFLKRRFEDLGIEIDLLKR